MEKIYKYYAFISYKHADEKWARWLQRYLENYRLPVALRKTNVPKRLCPVFRDETDLTPGILGEKLRENLELSNYLIVLCSKSLVKDSHYVDYEIQTFIDQGKRDKIILLIVDGEPNAENPENECFTELIKSIPGELVAVDLSKESKRNVALKIIASILKLDADDLINRDRKRRLRQWISGGIAAIAVMALLVTVFKLSLKNLEITARNYEIAAKNADTYNDRLTAVDNALKSLTVPIAGKNSSEAAQILRKHVLINEFNESNGMLHKEFETRVQHRNIGLYAESDDGEFVGFTDYSKVFVHSAVNGKYIETLSFYNKEEAERIGEYFPSRAIDDDVLSLKVTKVNTKKEAVKHIEKKNSDKTVSICDMNGNVQIYIDNSDGGARWAYNGNEDMIAVYEQKGSETIWIYSFEYQIWIKLMCPENISGVSSMYFSPKGKYLFVDFYRNSYTDYLLCVYDTESCSIVFEDSSTSSMSSLGHWVFSDMEKMQSFYVFAPHIVKKYSFTDRIPDIKNNGSADGTGEVFIVKHTDYSLYGLRDIFFSHDGTKALSKYYSNGKHFWSVFDINSGVTYINFADADGFDLTPDAKYIIYTTEDKHIIICDVENGTVLYDKRITGDTVYSAAISEDGMCAAYYDSEAQLVILKKDEDGDFKKSITIKIDSEFYGEILFINDTECCFNIDDGDVSVYDINTGDKRTLGSNTVYRPFRSTDSFQFFKAAREVSKFGLICNREESIAFYDINGEIGRFDVIDHIKDEIADDNLCFYPDAYSPSSNIYAGVRYTNQMQYNNEIVVVQVDKNDSKVLYRYSSSKDITSLRFDNNGKYIIINGTEGCEVIDAFSGELWFELDRNVAIHDDTVYDISDDLVLPDVLPRAKLYSVEELVEKGRELIK